MTNFKNSQWRNIHFVHEYQNDADIYMPFCNYIYHISTLFYEHFLINSLNSQKEVRILDLGCGNGAFIGKLLSLYEASEVVLIDGSQEMLDAARNRLKQFKNINYIKKTFQELFMNDSLNLKFEFIYSSLAIHHLSMEEKVRLYNFIYDLLTPGGYVLIYDVVLPPTEKIEKWYLSLWSDWIKENSDEETVGRLVTIPTKYKTNPDNVPDTLKSQMETLESIGFKHVDCYFKCGIVSLFGGCREG